MRRNKTSPNYITVNICSSVTPTKSTSTIRTPSSTKTPLTRTPIRTPLRSHQQQDENNQQFTNSNRKTRAKLTKNVSS